MVNTTEAGLHFQLIQNDSSPFDGFFNSYGLFRGVRNYIACVIEPSYPDTYQRCGFCAQQIVSLAVSLGLGTCYVGGTFSSQSVSAQFRAGEKLPFIIAIGYEDAAAETTIAKISRRMLHRHRPTVLSFLTNDTDIKTDELPADILQGLEAVSCAPSSMNRRPVKIRIKNETITALVQSSSPSELIDLGIALYNFQAVYPGIWQWGNPAKFIPD